MILHKIQKHFCALWTTYPLHILKSYSLCPGSTVESQKQNEATYTSHPNRKVTAVNQWHDLVISPYPWQKILELYLNTPELAQLDKAQYRIVGKFDSELNVALLTLYLLILVSLKLEFAIRSYRP